MKRRSFKSAATALALFMTLPLGLARAQQSSGASGGSQQPPGGSWEQIRQARQQIQQDEADIRKNQEDMKSNPADKAQDQQNIRNDLKNIRQERHDIHQERADIRKDFKGNGGSGYWGWKNQQNNRQDIGPYRREGGPDKGEMHWPPQAEHNQFHNDRQNSDRAGGDFHRDWQHDYHPANHGQGGGNHKRKW